MTEIHDVELIFEDILDAVVVYFVRMLPHPPAKVWERLLDRDHLTEWLTSEPGGHIRHCEGGEVLLPTIGGAWIESEVLKFIPEEFLLIGWETIYWDGGVVGWELKRVDDGTRLAFRHADPDRGPEHFARTLTNWHVTLDLFEASLSGKPRSWNWDDWEQQYRRYSVKLLNKMIDG